MLQVLAGTENLVGQIEKLQLDFGYIRYNIKAVCTHGDDEKTAQVKKLGAMLATWMQEVGAALERDVSK